MPKKTELTLEDVMQHIDKRHDEINSKIESMITTVQNEVRIIKVATETNAKKVGELEKDMEWLKQINLKNNVKISGLSNDKFDPKTLVYNLFNLLELELVEDDFVAYFTMKCNFIIVQFDNIAKKITIAA